MMGFTQHPCAGRASRRRNSGRRQRPQVARIIAPQPGAARPPWLGVRLSKRPVADAQARQPRDIAPQASTKSARASGGRNGEGIPAGYKRDDDRNRGTTIVTSSDHCGEANPCPSADRGVYSAVEHTHGHSIRGSPAKEDPSEVKCLTRRRKLEKAGKLITGRRRVEGPSGSRRASTLSEGNASTLVDRELVLRTTPGHRDPHHHAQEDSANSNALVGEVDCIATTVVIVITIVITIVTTVVIVVILDIIADSFAIDMRLNRAMMHASHHARTEGSTRDEDRPRLCARESHS